MKARHGMKPKGKPDDYSGSGEPNVVKEAMEKKHGGKVKKEVDRPEGKKAKMRMDKKPRRASGGMSIAPENFASLLWRRSRWHLRSVRCR